GSHRRDGPDRRVAPAAAAPTGGASAHCPTGRAGSSGRPANRRRGLAEAAARSGARREARATKQTAYAAGGPSRSARRGTTVRRASRSGEGPVLAHEVARIEEDLVEGGTTPNNRGSFQRSHMGVADRLAL